MYQQQGTGLGQIPWTDPLITALEIKAVQYLTQGQQAAIRKAVSDFPSILAQAKVDYAKFKAGLEAGLFVQSTNSKRVTDWFREFPRLWEAIRPNYEQTVEGGTVSTHRTAILNDGDAFVRKLGGDPQIQNRLGIAPILIAGVLIAGVAGVAGVIWAIGYVGKQNNISKIIDEAVAGRVPMDVLKKALEEADAGPGFMTSITDLLKWGAIGLGVFYLAPVVVGAFKKGRTNAGS